MPCADGSLSPGATRRATAHEAPRNFPTIHVCAQVPAVAFFGDWRCPLFPRLDAECLSFVGPPLQLPQLPEPTPEQVAGWDDAMYYLSMPCTQCNEL